MAEVHGLKNYNVNKNNITTSVSNQSKLTKV